MLLLLTLLCISAVRANVPIPMHYYALVNAMTHTSLNRTKEIMAIVYRERLYNTNMPRMIQVWQGTQKILNLTDVMQNDLIIQAIDGISPNASFCDWKNLFSAPFDDNVRFILFFTDAKCCGEEPLMEVGHIHQKHVVFPIMVGADMDMMFDMYRVWGPCAKPGCVMWRDYMKFDE